MATDLPLTRDEAAIESSITDGSALDETGTQGNGGDGSCGNNLSACDGGCISLDETHNSGQAGDYSIAVNATMAYWTRYYAGTLMSAFLDGGPPITSASAQAYPSSIAVDSTNAYWTDLGTSQNGTGTVMKMPLGGGVIVARVGPELAEWIGVECDERLLEP